jgi:hypothetical protein
MIVSSGFSHKNGHYSHSKTTLLAGSSTCRLFPVPQAEIHLKGICHIEEIKENSLSDLKEIRKKRSRTASKIGRNVGGAVH